MLKSKRLSLDFKGLHCTTFLPVIPKYFILLDPMILFLMQNFSAMCFIFQGIILSFVDAVLQDAEKLDPLNENETVEGLHPNGALMTEKELKSLVCFPPDRALGNP